MNGWNHRSLDRSSAAKQDNEQLASDPFYDNPSGRKWQDDEDETNHGGGQFVEVLANWLVIMGQP